PDGDARPLRPAPSLLPVLLLETGEDPASVRRDCEGSAVPVLQRASRRAPSRLRAYDPRPVLPLRPLRGLAARAVPRHRSGPGPADDRGGGRRSRREPGGDRALQPQLLARRDAAARAARPVGLPLGAALR